jgi:MFS family permease
MVAVNIYKSPRPYFIMVNFGDALRKGLKFCIEPRRWLPLLILDAAVLTIVISAMLTGMSAIMSGLLEAQGNPLAAASFAGYFIGLLVLGVAWIIVRLWIIGSLIHQSNKPREIEKGFRLSLSRLHRIIAVMILVAIISTIVGMVPFVGWLFALIVSWVFFFVFQGIILDNLGIISTMKNSLHMFQKKPFDVFIAWLLITLVSLAIVLAFALPFMGMFFGAVFTSAMTTGTVEPGALALLTLYLQTNLAPFIAFALLALVGLELSQAFSIKAQTEFYMQLRKKFPSLLKIFRR